MAALMTVNSVSAVDGLAKRCCAGLDVGALQPKILWGLREVMSIDAAFFATVDPATILFTSVIAEAPLEATTPQFLENEFGTTTWTSPPRSPPTLIPSDRWIGRHAATAPRAIGT